MTVYALTYAVGSPILAVAFNSFDRRTLLALALCCFVAANLLAAVAGHVCAAADLAHADGGRRRHLCMPTRACRVGRGRAPSGAAERLRW